MNPVQQAKQYLSQIMDKRKSLMSGYYAEYGKGGRVEQSMNKLLGGNYEMLTNLGMGATVAPEASLGQVMQAKRLMGVLGKGSEAVNPIEAMDKLSKLAKQTGVSMMEGKVPKSIEQVVNDIIKAKTIDASVTKYLRVPDIPKINLADKVQVARKYIQDMGTGLMKGSYGN